MYKIVYSESDSKLSTTLHEINGVEYITDMDAHKELTKGMPNSTKRIGLYKEINQPFAKYMLSKEFVIGSPQVVTMRTITAS